MSCTLDGQPLPIYVIDTLNQLFNFTVPTCNAFIAVNGTCNVDSFGNQVSRDANGDYLYEVTAAAYAYTTHCIGTTCYC